MTGLHLDELHGSLSDPVLRSMDFLNEVAERYPHAISLAAGRPLEQSFDVEDVHEHLRAYCRHLAQERGFDGAQVRRTLLQYGASGGIINDVIARHLAVDEAIDVDPSAVVVTVGCQEAIFLVLRALRADERDVLLAVSPAYVGMSGAARLVDLPVLPVASGERGVDLDDLARVARQARAAGLRPRACYVMPDFANPSGTSMDLATRQTLLRVAADENLLLLEDNPYGFFHDGEGRPPTLKSLDSTSTVVYLGSFAKTVFPGARIGYVVADQEVGSGSGAPLPFASHLATIKSMLTVNTPPIAQAVVASKLLSHGCSLTTATESERKTYQRNRRAMLDRLTGGLAGTNVSWNSPSGGFFVVVTVPFDANDAELTRCADEFGVLWVPMSHFYQPHGGERQLRLSCSAVSGGELDEAVDRLIRYLRTR